MKNENGRRRGARESEWNSYAKVKFYLNMKNTRWIFCKTTSEQTKNFEQYLKFKFMFNNSSNSSSTCAVLLSLHMTQRKCLKRKRRKRKDRTKKNPKYKISARAQCTHSHPHAQYARTYPLAHYCVVFNMKVLCTWINNIKIIKWD